MIIDHPHSGGPLQRTPQEEEEEQQQDDDEERGGVESRQADWQPAIPGGPQSGQLERSCLLDFFS